MLSLWCLAALSALTIACGAAVAAPTRKPDLVARAVSASTAVVHGADSFTARLAVRNLGRARARASRTGVFLSRDARRDRGDVLLADPRTPALAGRRRTRLAARVVVPADTAPGTYRLVACADLTHRVREVSNRNNCAASKATVAVVAPAASGGERHPPLFAGIEAATTCLAGPVGPPRSSSYYLRWSAATDDRTPQGQIVYDVYQATGAMSEDFAKPTYTTAPGATSFATPPLTSAETWHFVVRARDAEGNRDANTVERVGENLCV